MKLAFGVTPGKGMEYLSPPVAAASESSPWHHLAAVADDASTSVSFYCDGILVSTTASTPGRWPTVELGRAAIGNWKCEERPLGVRNRRTDDLQAGIERPGNPKTLCRRQARIRQRTTRASKPPGLETKQVK